MSGSAARCYAHHFAAIAFNNNYVNDAVAGSAL